MSLNSSLHFKLVHWYLLGLFSALNVFLFPFLFSLSFLFPVTFSTALENEVLRNPKHSLVNLSVLEPNPASMFPTDVYVEGCHDNLCDPGTSARACRRSQIEVEEVVAAALNRIQELEKEAETLEEAYRSYRRKGAVSHISFKGTSSPPPRRSPPFVGPIGAVKSRGFPEDVYTVIEQSQRPPGHMTPPTASSPPVRRLSSTPVSSTKTKPKAYAKQGEHCMH